MTPFMNARLETSDCVSIASLLLMSSSMAVALMGRNSRARHVDSRVVLDRALFRGFQAFGELRVATGVCRHTVAASTQAGVSDTSRRPPRLAAARGLSSLRGMRRTLTLAASLLD